MTMLRDCPIKSGNDRERADCPIKSDNDKGEVSGKDYVKRLSDQVV